MTVASIVAEPDQEPRGRPVHDSDSPAPNESPPSDVPKPKRRSASFSPPSEFERAEHRPLKKRRMSLSLPSKDAVEDEDEDVAEETRAVAAAHVSDDEDEDVPTVSREDQDRDEGADEARVHRRRNTANSSSSGVYLDGIETSSLPSLSCSPLLRRHPLLVFEAGRPVTGGALPALSSSSSSSLSPPSSASASRDQRRSPESATSVVRVTPVSNNGVGGTGGAPLRPMPLRPGLPAAAAAGGTQLCPLSWMTDSAIAIAAADVPVEHHRSPTPGKASSRCASSSGDSSSSPTGPHSASAAANDDDGGKTRRLLAYLTKRGRKVVAPPHPPLPPPPLAVPAPMPTRSSFETSRRAAAADAMPRKMVMPLRAKPPLPPRMALAPSTLVPTMAASVVSSVPAPVFSSPPVVSGSEHADVLEAALALASFVPAKLRAARAVRARP